MKRSDQRMIVRVAFVAVAVLSLGFLGAAMAAPGLSLHVLADGQGTIWVTNRTLNNVTAFDAATGAIVGIVAVGGEPNDVVAPQGTGKVYVSNEKSNSISVIDKRSMSVIATIPCGSKPHHIAASPNGRFVYFGEYGTNKVGVIDTHTDTLIAEYVATPDSNARTHAVFATPNGKVLLAANTGINEVAALNAETGDILWSMRVSDNPSPTANNPSEVLPDNTGKLAYATVRADNKLVVIDLEQRAIVGEVMIGVEPDTLSLSPNGKTLVVGLRGKPATIAVVDTQTLAVEWIAVPGTTTGHNDMSSNGHYSFVVVEGGTGQPAGVAVVNHRTKSVAGVYQYPANESGDRGRPHGLVFDPQRLER